MSNRKAGLAAREAAARALHVVLTRRLTVEQGLEAATVGNLLDARDRAFAARITLTALRRLGEIDRELGRFLETPLPRKSGMTQAVLRTAAAQLLFLGTSPHAAIGLAVEVVRSDRDGRHFAGLVNAVLRRLAEASSGFPTGSPEPAINTPSWLWSRWLRHYGEETAGCIARNHRQEPPLDLAVKGDAGRWAEVLSGDILLPDHLRLAHPEVPVSDLAGFASGEWWVQDVAASLPVRMLGDVRGKRVLDLCAAPGGKTLQLCARGADVTAVERSGARLRRLKENLARTGFDAEIIEADLRALSSTRTYDAVLLDAPCSATGTIRRHPEIPYIRTEADILRLAGLQAQLLDHAAGLTAPGGILVYCTCSLEPEEGEHQIERFLARMPEFQLWEDCPVIPGLPVPKPGVLRTLPCVAIAGMEGMDGFFAAALRRAS